MSKDVKISSIQLFLLLDGFIFGSSLIISPASTVGSDSWIAFILGWIGGFILVFVYINIAKLNPDKTLIEILKSNFGKYIGSFVGAVYIWYFLHLAALVFRNFGEFMVEATYLQTPMVLIIVCLAVPVAYAVRSGIEVLARVSELMVPYIYPVVVILLFAFLTTHDFTAFLPMLKDGIYPVLNTGFSVLSFPFGETVIFLMIFPYLNKIKNTGKTTYLAFLIAGIVLLLILLRNLMILGPKLLTNVNYPSHLIARLLPGISVEPLIDISFMIGGGVKIGVLIFGSAMGIAQLFKLGDYKPFVTAITVFCVVLSIWVYPNSLEMFRWASDIYQYYALPFQVIFPVLLLFISWIKNRKVKTN